MRLAGDLVDVRSARSARSAASATAAASSAAAFSAACPSATASAYFHEAGLVLQLLVLPTQLVEVLQQICEGRAECVSLVRGEGVLRVAVLLVSVVVRVDAADESFDGVEVPRLVELFVRQARSVDVDRRRDLSRSGSVVCC